MEAKSNPHVEIWGVDETSPAFVVVRHFQITCTLLLLQSPGNALQDKMVICSLWRHMMPKNPPSWISLPSHDVRKKHKSIKNTPTQ